MRGKRILVGKFRPKTGGWLCQPNISPKPACKELSKMLSKIGYETRITEFPNFCVVDFEHKELREKISKILEEEAERKKVDPRETRKYVLWSTGSSVGIWGNRELKAAGEIVAPFFHHPDFKSWTREEVVVPPEFNRLCKITEIHVHNTLGHDAVHVHFSCKSEDPDKLVYAIWDLAESMAYKAERFIDDTIRIAKEKSS